MQTDELGATKIEECETEGVEKYNLKHYGAFFTALETTYKCAGFC